MCEAKPSPENKKDNTTRFPLLHSKFCGKKRRVPNIHTSCYYGVIRGVHIHKRNQKGNFGGQLNKAEFRHV